MSARRHDNGGGRGAEQKATAAAAPAAVASAATAAAAAHDDDYYYADGACGMRRHACRLCEWTRAAAAAADVKWTIRGAPPRQRYRLNDI